MYILSSDFPCFVCWILFVINLLTGNPFFPLNILYITSRSPSFRTFWNIKNFNCNEGTSQLVFESPTNHLRKHDITKQIHNKFFSTMNNISFLFQQGACLLICFINLINNLMLFCPFPFSFNYHNNLNLSGILTSRNCYMMLYRIHCSFDSFYAGKPELSSIKATIQTKYSFALAPLIIDHLQNEPQQDYHRIFHEE